MKKMRQKFITIALLTLLSGCANCPEDLSVPLSQCLGSPTSRPNSGAEFQTYRCSGLGEAQRVSVRRGASVARACKCSNPVAARTLECKRSS